VNPPQRHKVKLKRTSKEVKGSAQFSPEDMSKQLRREHVGAGVVIVAITAILFAPVFQGRTFSMVGAHMYAQYPWGAIIQNDPSVEGRGYPQTDQAETFYPLSVFGTNALLSGQIPMWLPYSFGGIPILELGMTGLLYPPRLLLMFLVDPIDQHDLLLITHLLMAGLGMYALLRCWGANAIGAVFGAVVWEMNGHSSFWLTFEHVALATAWFPLMLLCATLSVRRRSFPWAVGAGAAVGMAMVSGSLHVAYLSGLVLAVWYGVIAAAAALRSYREGQRRPALTYLALPLCSLAVALALTAAFWLPLSEWLSRTYRQALPPQAQIMNGLSFSEIAGAMIKPRSASGVAGKTADFPSFAFTGILAVGLSLLSLLAMFRRSGPVILGVILCALSLGFALGFGPLITVFRSTLPFFGTINPYVGLYLYCFAIAVLSAFGITEVGRYLARLKVPKHLPVILGLLIIAFEAWQLIGFAWTINPTQPKRAEWLFPETPVIKALQGLQGEYHILPVVQRLASGQWTPPVMIGKVAADFGLRSDSGYESLLPVYTAGIWRTIEQGGNIASDVPPAYRPGFGHDRLPFALLERVSIGFLITPPGVRPRDIGGGEPNLELVYSGRDGWIYKDNRALPRAFLVPQTISVPDSTEALQMLVSPSFDAREKAILIGEKSSAAAALLSNNGSSTGLDAKATIIRDRLNEVEIQAATPRRAMLVLNDSWAPGWKAFVDGVEQPALRVNYAFRGVVVPEGQHRVLFLYRPTVLLVGLAISGFSLLFVCALYLWIGVRYLRPT